MTPILYVGLYYLLDCDYLLLHEVGITFFNVIGQCDCYSGIPVDIQCILTKFNSKQSERINFKKVLLLLLQKCLKRCIYAISVVLLLYDFNFYVGGQMPQCFPEKREMRNFFLENSVAKVSFSFDVSLKLIRGKA